MKIKVHLNTLIRSEVRFIKKKKMEKKPHRKKKNI